jgi:hypothetical protein
VKSNREGLGKHRRWWIGAVAGVLACCAAVASEPPARGQMPDGERLVYQIRWMQIPAGEAVLETAAAGRFDGRPARHFIMTVRTNDFVDTFYKVRSRIESWTDAELTRSLRYRKQQREGNHRPRDERVDFNWSNRSVIHSNRNRTRAPLFVPPSTLDPLAALYFTREAPLRTGDEITRPVTDGKKIVTGRARVVGRERIQVPAGVFDTVMIEPDLRDVGGVFEKSPEARIQLWLSDDERRIPVRVHSKVVVGYFVGELTAMQGGSAGIDARIPSVAIP